MAQFTCCSAVLRKTRNKVAAETSRSPDFYEALRTLRIRLEHTATPSQGDGFKATPASVEHTFGIHKESLDVKMTSNAMPVQDKPLDIACEGENVPEKNESMKKFSVVANSGDELTQKSVKLGNSKSFDAKFYDHLGNRSNKDNHREGGSIQTGYMSDPGTSEADLWDSPKIKRSCSNLESNKVLRKVDVKSIPASLYTKIMKDLPEQLTVTSSKSVISNCSADKVLLKRHSLSQVLPSRSRKSWWRLFLWSHRNMHKSWSLKPQSRAVRTALNQQSGYISDTFEPKQASKLTKMQSHGSFTKELLEKGHNINEEDNKGSDGYQVGKTGLWPQKQWVAFSLRSSSNSKVDAWIRDLETPPSPLSYANNEDNENNYVFPGYPENEKKAQKSSGFVTQRPDLNLSNNILHANYSIQSLNSSSTAAHISGIGLEAIPTTSHFFNLRSINLSNNSIDSIIRGSLPKGLITLNLSRNKIRTIEGLRELTRLRVLDLSYNCLSRIGPGLSNCTIIKELYIAGNKISEVDGLHRLLKLNVLDLSFNKITTTKALGQLVANYNSLQALNLLGNPIQGNVGDDQMRKSVCSLLPKLAYLNKQAIKRQRAREALIDNVAKAALRTSSKGSSSKRAVKRTNLDGSGSSKHISSIGSRQKSRSRSNN